MAGSARGCRDPRARAIGAWSLPRAPGVYQLCKKGGGATALLFVNIHDDPIFDGEIVLDGAYSEMEICGAEGELAGDRVKLKTVVPPHGAVALVLK